MNLDIEIPEGFSAIDARRGTLLTENTITEKTTATGTSTPTRTTLQSPQQTDISAPVPVSTTTSATINPSRPTTPTTINPSRPIPVSASPDTPITSAPVQIPGSTSPAQQPYNDENPVVRIGSGEQEQPAQEPQSGKAQQQQPPKKRILGMTYKTAGITAVSLAALITSAIIFIPKLKKRRK